MASQCNMALSARTNIKNKHVYTSIASLGTLMQALFQAPLVIISQQDPIETAVLTITPHPKALVVAAT